MKHKIFILLSELLCATTVWAENYNVNTDSKLREAIQNDNANITLTADIDLTNSTLEITNNRTVTINMNNHTLDRKLTKRGEGGGQVFTVRSGSTLNLNGGTVKGGWGGGGGGLLNEGGTVNLTNVTITGNTADDRGGGIYNTTDGVLTMTGCTVTGNTSNNHTNPKGGGGIYNAGTLKIQGKNTVTGNTAGGSTDNLFLATGTLITLTGKITGSNIGISLQGTTGIFTTGYATYYGSTLDLSGQIQPGEFFTADDDIYYDVVLESAEASIASATYVGPVTTESLLRTAVATDGVKIRLGSDITVSKHLTIWDNVTIDLNGYTLRGDDTPVTQSGDFKCIFIVAPAGNLNLSNGTLADADNSATDNSTHNGGAIVNKGTATLTGVTITNCKGTDGGGIRNNEGATLTIDGCTITDNTGDGIYNEGTLNMKGAITVTGNKTTELLDDNVYLKSGSVSGLINVVGSLEGSTISINLVCSGVFTNHYSDYNSGIDPSTYFTADYTNVFGMGFSGTEAALTGGPFYYIDREWDEENKIVVPSVKKLSNGHVINSMAEFDPYYDKNWLGNDFYVFNRDDLDFHGDLIVSGGHHARMLLCDGSKLSIGDFGGLRLHTESGSDTPILRIYGQLKNSGLLYIRPETTEKWRAGIGTDTSCDEPLNIYGGTLDVEGSTLGGAAIGTAPGASPQAKKAPFLKEINIYGGIIKAKGGRGAAGIGSGAPGADYSPEDYGNINIYGGKITATGGSYSYTFASDVGGAGIGGGNGNKHGNLHIYGGDITAIGGLDAAGIGCGQDGGVEGAGHIIIEGGHVVAHGDLNADSHYGAGIGGGDGRTNYKVEIKGGEVYAYGGTDAAGIGGGEGGAGGTITITGGYVYAKGIDNGAGIGGGERGHSGIITINGGDVFAYGGTNAAGIGGGGGSWGGAGGDGYKITINGGYVYAEGNDTGAGIGGGNEGYGGDITINGGTVIAKAGTAGTNEDHPAAIGAGIDYDNDGDLTFADDLGVFITTNLYRSQKANRVSDCRNYRYVKITKCAHGEATASIVDGKTHNISNCKWCLVTGEETHTFGEDGQCPVCKLIRLEDEGDNSALFSKWADDEPHSFVISGRKLSAAQDEAGNWSNRAYTVCVPFDMDLAPYMDSMSLYSLDFIKDGKDMVFTENVPYMEAGMPYLIVMRQGEMELLSKDMVLTDTPAKGRRVRNWDDTDDELGWWRGTLTKTESADAAELMAYVLQSDGTFHRITPESGASLNAFRAMYCPDVQPQTNIFTIRKGILFPGGSEEDDYITNFDTAEFISDAEIGGTGIKEIEHGILNIKHSAGAVYDLSGRKVNSQFRKKGVYIYNGRKIVVK